MERLNTQHSATQLHMLITYTHRIVIAMFLF